MSVLKEEYLGKLAALSTPQLLSTPTTNGSGSGSHENVGRKPNLQLNEGDRGNLGASEKKLMRLRPIHRRIILLHLMGLSQLDIVSITGHSSGAISRILRDPLSRPYMDAHISMTNQELESLLGLAVDAVRTGLMSDSETTRLKASDHFFKATGRYGEAAKSAESAEDVIGRALAAMAASNMATASAVERQAGAISNLAGKVDSGKIIDMRPDSKEEELKFLPQKGELDGDQGDNPD